MTKEKDTVARSYQLLALLDVCQQCAREIGGKDATRIAGNLAQTLGLASEIADEIHDAIELREGESIDGRSYKAPR